MARFPFAACRCLLPSSWIRAWLLCGVGLGLAVTFGLSGTSGLSATEPPTPSQRNRDAVLADRPVAFWDFEDAAATGWSTRSLEAAPTMKLEGAAEIGMVGPSEPEYPTFQAANQALRLAQARGFLRVHDPGDQSWLDFRNGETITIEAWVNPDQLANDQQVYIVGKGRTNNAGFPRDNQNYGFRLRGVSGQARVSFLFRAATETAGTRDDFHRWTSADGFAVDGQWHHVAVSYEFGRPESIRAYVDGRVSDGAWDLGGPTTAAPVVDNDELWIGSSMGTAAAATFPGRLDDVALYRQLLPSARLTARYRTQLPDPRAAEWASADALPNNAVLVELFEGNPKASPWSFTQSAPQTTFTQQTFALADTPQKYTATGAIGDRSDPYLVRARAKLHTAASEAGTYRVLLRARSAARLYLDGQLIVQTPLMNRNSSGHEAVPELASSEHQDLRPLPPDAQERLVSVALPAGDHLVRLEALVGGAGVRRELGELSVALGKEGQPLRILGVGLTEPIAATQAAWDRHLLELAAILQRVNAKNRLQATEAWRAYWTQRHEIAEQLWQTRPELQPAVPDATADLGNPIDRFIQQKLAQPPYEAAAVIDDHGFLRRAFLDVVGVVPQPAEVDQFFSDPRERRRSRLIERLLADPRWADHWMGYWQDVLAENPGILKPELNNTGPFRWWLYESFLDNKPVDQWVTELVRMEGSTYYGGPAGFALATQNDVPMAAKAHVLAQAFLGLELKCARCHDAPYHPFRQEQLFNLAALLENKPLQLPATSTVPVVAGARKPLIEITLLPGQTVAPAWPFPELGGSDSGKTSAELPPETLRSSSVGRDQFAFALTGPHNERFPQVIVNRLWQRYFGLGLVEPLDDWSAAAEPSHPELLKFLARELVLSGYNLKHVARLILNSQAYQRDLARDQEMAAPAELFASASRRRLTAEQLVDSLFTISDKKFQSEWLTLDPEGRRPANSFLNLGLPSRAWQFTSLSNERDRPALALPMAQSFVDLLLAYGWRDSRPNPISQRDETATMLQPLTLAHGVIGRRAVTLSDDHAVTQLCLTDQPLDDLIQRVYLLVLCRPAADDEISLFRDLLIPGYSERWISLPPSNQPKPAIRRNAVSWSNHLSAEATQIKLELERAVQAGDPPTSQLTDDWRQRMEDMLWALVNSPEFMFLP